MNEPPRRTIKELLAIAEDNVKHGYGSKPDDYTCFDCKDAFSCALAFDPYNLDGDCLASK